MANEDDWIGSTVVCRCMGWEFTWAQVREMDKAMREAKEYMDRLCARPGDTSLSAETMTKSN